MKVPRIIRKSPLYQAVRKTSWGKKYLIRTGKLVSREELIQVHAEGTALRLDSSIKAKPVVGIVYPEELISGYIYWRKFSKRPASPPTMKSGNMKISVEHTTYTKYTIYLVFQLYLLTLGKNRSNYPKQSIIQSL